MGGCNVDKRRHLDTSMCMFKDCLFLVGVLLVFLFQQAIVQGEGEEIRRSRKIFVLQKRRFVKPGLRNKATCGKRMEGTPT